MLYKKIHRQYLREFRKGRKFLIYGYCDVCDVTREPYIEDNYITIGCWRLIPLWSGELWYKSEITFLD